ncbi:dfb42ad6-8e30-4271-9a93-d58effc31d4b [Sclerotinia trifoliorum]|uniref:Dfb42ad6-8e30-4271-9a93-d58effc31d4b n=1 Tax=Sclerotinia trifoliorum TaxID=28548 RepID=A0A8H2ZU00_9HELO|nr:dfb42ad6-8e30-4271-9a93-d58effc31d4b [Sclerotinia trifoliorum]
MTSIATTTDALTTAPVNQTGLLANAPDNLDAKISSEIHALDHESSLDHDGLLRPTEEERTTLRRVSGSIPWTAYMICLVEFAERASYYGCQFVFSNFVQFPLPKGGNGAGATPAGTQQTPGALGKGLTVSSALNLLFKFLAYTIPVFGGWLADTKLGRFKTICIGVFVFGVAHLVLVLGALPSVLQAGHGMAPFVIGIITLAFGAGLFKSNVSPMLLDQDTQKGLIVKALPDGEKVILDPEVTAQRLALAFYGMVNVGAFFGIATTYSEKKVGFWLAYGLPMILYLLLPILLWVMNKRLVKYPPQGSDIGKFFKVIGIAIRRNGLKGFGRKGYLDAAKPSVLAAQGITGDHNGKQMDWTDAFVEDVKRSLEACTIFLFFPIYNLNDGGIGNITTSQGSAMVTNDAPNDLLNNFNALTVIFTIPLLSYGLYPLLRRHKIHFGPIKRITLGFLIAAVSSAIGAITQWRIYETSPCGYYATGCEIGTGVAPISIWWQLPQWSLGGISECFANVTALELAYSRAPANMKGMITSMYLFSVALSAAIAQACTPSLADPYLIWPYVAPAVAGTLLAIWFYFLYRDLDKEEYVRGGAAETIGEEQRVEHRESISGDGNQKVRPDEKV